MKTASIFETSVEQPWHTALLQAVDRVAAGKPHGLDMSLDSTESVAPPDAERVLRQYADSGEYQIIWAHSAYSDAIRNLRDEYPDIAWVFAGSGNEGLGDNAYWVDVFIHEPAYLAGIVAGMMTESNVIGAVASFPFPNVNAPLNAYIEGARSVNPDVDVKVTYIESWFDPPKAKESALAQIAAGADVIYAGRFGPFEACKEQDVLCIGHFVDQYSRAPEVVVTSPIAVWDPSVKNIVDAWWDYTTQGTPFEAPMERIVFLLDGGGADLAPFYDFEDTLSPEVLEAVAQAKAAIQSGELVIEFNEAPIE